MCHYFLSYVNFLFKRNAVIYNERLCSNWRYWWDSEVNSGSPVIASCFSLYNAQIFAMKCHPYLWTKVWWDQHNHFGSPRVDVFSRESPKLATSGFHANAERSTLQRMCFPSCLLQGFSASCTYSVQFWIYSWPTNAIFFYLPEILSIATEEFKLIKGGQLNEE